MGCCCALCETPISCPSESYASTPAVQPGQEGQFLLGGNCRAGNETECPPGSDNEMCVSCKTPLNTTGTPNADGNAPCYRCFACDSGTVKKGSCGDDWPPQDTTMSHVPCEGDSATVDKLCSVGCPGDADPNDPFGTTRLQQSGCSKVCGIIQKCAGGDEISCGEGFQCAGGSLPGGCEVWYPGLPPPPDCSVEALMEKCPPMCPPDCTCDDIISAGGSASEAGGFDGTGCGCPVAECHLEFEKIQCEPCPCADATCNDGGQAQVCYPVYCDPNDPGSLVTCCPDTDCP
jgi:hypothetical protein